MRPRRVVVAAAGELEVGVRSGEAEEHPVVAVVVAKAPELGEPEAVAIEADDLFESPGVPCEPDLHRPGRVVSEEGA